MNSALWRKAFADSRGLCFWLAVLLFGFQWIFIWGTSQIDMTALAFFLDSLPPMFQKLPGIPIREVATITGRVALAYIDPVVLFAAACWSVARGSDVVSGEIGRGTMEMLLAQPVRRVEVLLSQAVVTAAGTVLLGAACWTGTYVGLHATRLSGQVDIARFVPAAINLVCLMFFLTAFATLVSSADHQRWRTIGLVGGFYMVQLVLKVLSRLVERLDGLRYTTFLGAFEPQTLVVQPAEAWSTSLRYDGTLVGLGLAAYILAAVIFCRRDLPAPL